MSSDSLEYLYMPSNFVVRLPPSQAVPLFVEATSKESARVRKAVEGSLGLSYGPKDGDVVDLFNTQGQSGQLMVFLSGGYWQELSGEISASTVQPLVDAGHTVAVVHYTRAPKQSMGALVNQV